ncbi:MAG: flagellar basal-body MS-ring/collar protein FliF [Negativicutes bacterium]|nr:flagellar basal-body MS-ring/collar protein FliF [Negativicutes bacterium]
MADFRQRLTNVWNNLSRTQRLGVAAGGVALLAAVVLASVLLGGKTEYVSLFTGLEPRDAGSVTAKLKEMKVPYEIDNDGTTILVPAREVYKIRMDLASQGLPRGNKGFEIFEQNKFGTTDFQNKMNLLQAIQGELAQTIEAMPEVRQARVAIVMPEESLYKQQEKEATASIMLIMEPSAKLTREQVRGIVNLVAHSVQGLKPENITVVDENANILNNDMDPLATGTMTQMEMTRKMQDQLQQKVESLLEKVLGQGKAAARVSLELDFDQKSVDRQTYQPVVGDSGIVRSQQESKETYKGSGNTASGPAGAASNIPSYPGNSGGNNRSDYSKTEKTTNYEINETKEKVVASPGTIKRMTVAVLLDTSVQAQASQIRNAVANTVGIDPRRGDQLTVELVPFSTELAEKKKAEAEQLAAQEKQALYTKIGIGVGSALVVLLLVWMISRRKRKKEEELALAAAGLSGAAYLPGERPEEEEIGAEELLGDALTPEERLRIRELESLKEIADQQPENVANLLKVWLSED